MRNLLTIAIILAAGMAVSAQTNSKQHHATDKNASTRTEQTPAAEVENSFPRTSYSYPLDDYKPGVVQVGPRTTYLKEGLRKDEVVRLLGQPTATSERRENDVVVTVYEFQRGEHRVLVAEFVGDLLIGSRTETRDEQVVHVDNN